MNLGESIKYYRKLNGYDREELGNLINKSQYTIKKYELGEVIPTLDVIKILSNVLDVSSYTLIEAYFEGDEND